MWNNVLKIIKKFANKQYFMARCSDSNAYYLNNYSKLPPPLNLGFRGWLSFAGRVVQQWPHCVVLERSTYSLITENFLLATAVPIVMKSTALFSNLIGMLSVLMAKRRQLWVIPYYHTQSLEQSSNWEGHILYSKPPEQK